MRGSGLLETSFSTLNTPHIVRNGSIVAHWRAVCSTVEQRTFVDVSVSMETNGCEYLVVVFVDMW
jgi:hypothetical protein